MLAPKIQESAFGKSVMWAISWHVAVQSSSASSVASTSAPPRRPASSISSAMNSTWVSMLGDIVVKGPFWPRITNMLGKRAVVTPR